LKLSALALGAVLLVAPTVGASAYSHNGQYYAYRHNGHYYRYHHKGKYYNHRHRCHAGYCYW